MLYNRNAPKMTAPFWETKSLAEMSRAEWEALCDGCARCCLHKLEDEETGDLYFTSIACRELDLDCCRCQHYGERQQRVPECVILHPGQTEALAWMPASCAYRRLAEGKPLPQWHPLLSGRADSVHEAGVSVRSYAISEQSVTEESLEEYILDGL